ncbi:hypothetical protein M3Y98_00729100 [Aphelenchoides besseyi]|nr:hypothetical protein M3Y98_00729100 [Aphelenchoides besseyi]KAI6211353.1 hypothetical protein M3Y96_00425200 [Aphelenchoides besseyi]
MNLMHVMAGLFILLFFGLVRSQYHEAMLPGTYDCTLCGDFCNERRNYCKQFGKRGHQFKCVQIETEDSQCACGCFPKNDKHFYYQYDKKSKTNSTETTNQDSAEVPSTRCRVAGVDLPDRTALMPNYRQNTTMPNYHRNTTMPKLFEMITPTKQELIQQFDVKPQNPPTQQGRWVWVPAYKIDDPMIRNGVPPFVQNPDPSAGRAAATNNQNVSPSNLPNQQPNFAQTSNQQNDQSNANIEPQFEQTSQQQQEPPAWLNPDGSIPHETENPWEVPSQGQTNGKQFPTQQTVHQSNQPVVVSMQQPKPEVVKQNDQQSQSSFQPQPMRSPSQSGTPSSAANQVQPQPVPIQTQPAAQQSPTQQQKQSTQLGNQQTPIESAPPSPAFEQPVQGFGEPLYEDSKPKPRPLDS